MNIQKNIPLHINKIAPRIPEKYRSDFAFQRFQTNNKRIFFLSLFLFFEQLAYAFFISGLHGELRNIYLSSAILMLLMCSISGYLYLNPPDRIRFYHKFYELSLGIFGMGIALIRFLFFEFDGSRIPTIYIAVLYGIAVVFIFPYWQGFLLYSLLSSAIILLIPRFHYEIETVHYIADIASNGLIAWLISAINYTNFVKGFRQNKEIEAVNEVLEERSLKDELTGLYNRRKLNESLKEISARSERYRTDFAVITMDIDFFKRINDSYGHDAGDMVLQEIAAILKENIREVDICGRWGGEEFLIICPETDMFHASQIAERLRYLIMANPFQGQKVITASFGIASSEEFRDLEQILKASDTRLYEAKLRGRNRVVTDSD